MDQIAAILIAIAIAVALYTAIEFREVWNANRDAPMKPVSGPDSVQGRIAVVSEAFTRSSTGALVGRVEFDGENWRAEYVGNLPKSPEIGQRIEICGIDTGKLTVNVE